MMLRSAAIQFTGALALLVGLGLPDLASAAEVIRIGTLAPAASPFGQVFKVWAEAVKKQSNGQLELQFFYNGIQGDEGMMVGKIKTGQLDGAAVTGVGLGKIYKPILALEMPGLFTSWAKLDLARAALKTELEKGASDAGFTISGWGDVGLVHQFSKGFEIRTPDDLKGKKPVQWRDDPVQPIYDMAIGGVTPVPLRIPEVAPQLTTGAINALSAASLPAEQLQWTSRLDTIQDEVRGVTIGAIVLSTKRIDALSPDLKSIMIDTGKVAANALTTRIRNEDDAAFLRLKGKMTVVSLTPAERARWDALHAVVRQKLAQGTFAPELITRLEGFASQLTAPELFTATYYCGKHHCFKRGLDPQNPAVWTAAPILASAISLPPPAIPSQWIAAPRSLAPTTVAPPEGMYCDPSYCYSRNSYNVWIADYTGGVHPPAPPLPAV